MLDMHNPWSSLAITVKAVLIWDPRLDIRLRNAPFYSSQKLPLAPTSHSIWNGVAIFIVYLPRLKHFSPGCFDILEGGIILPIKIIGLARDSILQITLLPLFKTYHVHASSFCEVSSELCVGLSCHKKRKFLQSFLNFSSSDARIVPVFPMKVKSFDLCFKYISKGNRFCSTE